MLCVHQQASCGMPKTRSAAAGLAALLEWLDEAIVALNALICSSCTEGRFKFRCNSFGGNTVRYRSSHKNYTVGGNHCAGKVFFIC